MNPNALTDTLPEAMGDVPGICELPLTRAIVQYRDVHELDTPGGRIEDIGLALVIEGRFAASAEALDLGSGRMKVLDLSTELVVLDWVYEPTLEHVTELLTAAASTQREGPLRQYAFRLGLRVLERLGFGPLTRPTFLRVGYRDVCRDLDLHEGTSIRIVLGEGRLTRVHLDYDSCALVFRTAFHDPDAQLERALVEAFPEADVLRLVPVAGGDALDYQVRFPLPQSLVDARTSLAAMRRGLVGLIARFEPARFEALDRVLDTFGARETLAGLSVHQPRVRPVRVFAAEQGSASVH
jgi:hypothetical protein